MKQYINNRKFYDIQKLGDPFTFGLRLSYLPALGTAGDPTQQSNNLAVPIFAVGMLANNYSETNKWTGTTLTTVNGFNYLNGYANLNTSSPVPRNSFNGGTPYGGSFLIYGYSGTLSGALTGSMAFLPNGIDYINFINHLWKTKLLCTNVNVQVTQKGNDKNYLQNQWTFFDQKINGEMYTETTSLNRFINPQTNVATTNTFNNIDIPCDWVVTPYSGISVGFNALFCDDSVAQNGRDGYQLNFTFQEIIK